ncbi:hypothetical protein HMPREF1544_09572 [Mucor circinelloides 1006PhL]|uniref:WW domain-containing protein n=1 Tax=Mucor circinelloides f. circinelloides (strain 1006PhL) TaxID=1220926 RepID=S2J0R4_MUCC1|nr:hypothetical protein HMPREF1544_09572 [Mucor circinelloides 1006PhL]
MKLNSIAFISSFLAASAFAQIEEIEDQLWNDESSAWQDVNSLETRESLKDGIFYEAVTVTTTWVPPDINQWAYPAEYFATTTTEYDTEEEAEMALEQNEGKKKHFRRKKKHFKKKHHRKMMKPQVYLDQQSSGGDASVYGDNNDDTTSFQEGDISIEQWEVQLSNVMAASAYSYKNEISSGESAMEEASISRTELALTSASVEAIETLLPKVLLNDQAGVEAASSSANTVRNTASWTVGSLAVACYIFFT